MKIGFMLTVKLIAMVPLIVAAILGSGMNGKMQFNAATIWRDWGQKMAFLRSLLVWLVVYGAQCWVGIADKWHLTSIDFYMFYGVATLMMVISYVTGRIEDLKDS